jgi:molecular chaperone GrpE
MDFMSKNKSFFSKFNANANKSTDSKAAQHSLDEKETIGKPEEEIQDTLDKELNEDTQEIEKSKQKELFEALELNEALKKEANDFKEKWMRGLAEIENMRKRFQKEKEETAKYVLQNFARDLVRVADNLALALKNLPETPDETFKNLILGVEMTEKELLRVFEAQGIKRIESLNKKFDAHFHQAMFEVESEAEPGLVVQVLQEGYTLHDRLLRPSLVGVSKAKSDLEKNEL